MVILTYGLEETKHETLQEAFKDLHKRLTSEKGISEQFLTTIWIKHFGVPLFFPQICDLAHSENWLSEDGKLLI